MRAFTSPELEELQDLAVTAGAACRRSSGQAAAAHRIRREADRESPREASHAPAHGHRRARSCCRGQGCRVIRATPAHRPAIVGGGRGREAGGRDVLRSSLGLRPSPARRSDARSGSATPPCDSGIELSPRSSRASTSGPSPTRIWRARANSFPQTPRSSRPVGASTRPTPPPGSSSSSKTSAPTGDRTAAIGSSRSNLRQAETFFNKAIELDGSLTEARLHLGRVLGLEGRHEDAANELRRVAVTAGDSLTQYDAWLFLGARGAVARPSGSCPRILREGGGPVSTGPVAISGAEPAGEAQGRSGGRAAFHSAGAGAFSRRSRA